MAINLVTIIGKITAQQERTICRLMWYNVGLESSEWEALRKLSYFLESGRIVVSRKSTKDEKLVQIGYSRLSLVR